MKNKIIWYVHPYAGGPGVGRYDRPFHMAKYWQELGCNCVIVAPNQHHLMDKPHKHGTKKIAGVTYDFLKTPAYKGNGLGRLLNMFAFVGQLLARSSSLEREHGRPSVLVASSPHPYVFLATRIIAWRFKAVSVFEVRDLWPLSLIELAGVSAKHPLVLFTGWLEKYAYRKADFIVSLLPCTLEHMKTLGMAKHKWRYIPNGIDGKFLANDHTTLEPCIELARKWKKEGRLVVVYTGALGRPNHVETLLHAMKKLHQGGSLFSTIIVGRGELKSDLEALVTDLGLGACVSLFDQISKSSVQSLLREASVGYISLRPEPIFRFGISPNKMFDYMLASLPIVAAIKAGNDPVTEANCGYTADPDNVLSIVGALKAFEALDEVERLELGKNGRNYVLEKHSYGVLAQNYLRLFKAS